jgi:hypothetical protein
MAPRWHGVVLMLLAALAVCSNSQPLPTPIGGYLGCFDLSKLQVDSVKVGADVSRERAVHAAAEHATCASTDKQDSHSNHPINNVRPY